jgi:RNA polymerase sigma factor (sigma-70 family)
MGKAKPGPDRTQGRVLDGEALEALLAPDRGQAGIKYVELRRSLVLFFGWRGIASPDECADEALDRAGRRLAAGASVAPSDLSVYVYGVARNIVREQWKSAARASAGGRAREARFPLPLDPQVEDETSRLADRRSACLDACLARLDPESRRLILGYYEGQHRDRIDHRQVLARELGVSPESLRVRLHRIRARLLVCLNECLGAAGEPGATARRPSDES